MNIQPENWIYSYITVYRCKDLQTEKICAHYVYVGLNTWEIIILYAPYVTYKSSVQLGGFSSLCPLSTAWSTSRFERRGYGKAPKIHAHTHTQVKLNQFVWTLHTKRTDFPQCHSITPSEIINISIHLINTIITYMSVYVLKVRSFIASGAIQRIGSFPSVLL